MKNKAMVAVDLEFEMWGQNMEVKGGHTATHGNIFDCNVNIIINYY